jgi:hypothetical protein
MVLPGDEELFVLIVMSAVASSIKLLTLATTNAAETGTLTDAAGKLVSTATLVVPVSVELAVHLLPSVPL